MLNAEYGGPTVRRHSRWTRPPRPIGVAVLVTLVGVAAHAQGAPAGGHSGAPAGAPNGERVSSAPADSGAGIVVLAPGPQYRRSPAVEGILGRHYRALWATPIHVPVLDLRTFGGGLTPVRAHAGSQTPSLRFTGADGRTYQFRSVDKDPTAHLAPELRRSFAARALQDGVSASHPVGSLVASALLGAVDVLHVDQTLVVLPDDAALGEYRRDFAGVFGMIEDRSDDIAVPDATSDEGAAGAQTRVISPTKLYERVDHAPDDRVDARAFLAARVMDIFMGDRDRHRDQFRWARRDSADVTYWEPISRDHDEAFVKLDGPVLELASLYFPQLVNFTEKYPPHAHLNNNARGVDRRFLPALDRAAWDSVATALRARLTDAVIDDAVRRLPPEMYAVGGASLARTLKVRRDHLVAEALGYYAFLAREVEIHATDAAEVADVTRVDDHHVDVAIRRAKAGARPYYQRRFDDAETREIRLKLFGGNDRVVVRGDASPRITLRVVGGAGDDALVDSTRTGGVAFYDDAGDNRVSGVRRARLNTRPYTEWVSSDTSRDGPREYGTWWRPVPWLGAGSDLGLVVGGGFRRTSYGFRKSPFATDVTARAAYATGAAAAAGELLADVRRENRAQYWHLRLLASGIEVARYYGLGNQSDSAGGSTYHRVASQQYAVEPSAVWPLGSRVVLGVGPLARWSRTSTNAGRFIGTIRDTLYGGRDFGELGARLGIVADTRDKPANPHRGVLLSGEGRFYPAVWDATRPFGSVEGRAETYLTAPVVLTPTLALRVDGKKLWGTFPFQESAFIGGPTSVRGFYQQRFAGDASLSGSAELRLTLARTGGFLPALWGVFGNGDAGRVYVDGRSPGGWHTGAGGGVWVALLDRANTASIGITHSREQTSVRAGFGFGF
jgi:hypothetical protein